MLPVLDAVIKNNNISIDVASLNIKIFGKFEELLKKHSYILFSRVPKK